jgi:tetratricopeptide (TPR) repeat protein
LAHISRRELKRDELQTTLEEFQDFAKRRSREITTVAIVAIVVIALVSALKVYQDRQQAAANLQLGAALSTFGAYVGAAPSAELMPGAQTFPTAQAKYQKALGEFQQIVQKFSSYPQPKAVAIARYHVGLCQAQLGQDDAAIKTLREAAGDSDRSIAALAEFALAGELAKTGKLAEAAKLYEQLADRPAPTVPAATARLALADAYRTTQPAKAREIYQQLQNQFGSDVTLAQVLQEQIASLPK